MERMKTTWAIGGSQGQQTVRAIHSYSTSQQSNNNHSKYNLDLVKLTRVFNQIGYFIPVILSAEQWINLTPKDKDAAPNLKVYILADYQSFYMMDCISGELGFYSCNGNKPNFSDDSIFNKLDGGSYDY
ncbi:hypothetical protein [Thiomicrorhabdus sp. Milos-T2]|uniref:hypothetical protein n=1 Tax=Thiomicrorhabdus sp. Milos-T2 TaxID=90814 RepID=UPI00049449A7|nr:hypothetical protein [Thiomicrorhabdus sp. Milos-T2]